MAGSDVLRKIFDRAEWRAEEGKQRIKYYSSFTNTNSTFNIHPSQSTIQRNITIMILPGAVSVYKQQ